ncbi:DNA polymerase zeta [Ascosphaera acerosa]|nr:DNA polymerase zeta [Ascosphaera acerosa]
METFSFRLGFVDHYQAEPSHLDPSLPRAYAGAPAEQRPHVPVLRVFGSTDTGQKVCAHVHGAFPYIYVGYDGDANPASIAAAQESLHQAIDEALASSCPPLRDRPVAFVAHISVVKGTPFYGYHVGYRLFFKIYLLNPKYTLRLADLLRRGAILGRRFQPYESHLQYRSQWMIDYNLYGCANIRCRKVTFRQPVPHHDAHQLRRRWDDRTIMQSGIGQTMATPRQSYCELEVDLHVQDICNRLDIKERRLHRSLDAENVRGAECDKLVPSLAALWHEEAERRRKGADVPLASPFSTADLLPSSHEKRTVSQNRWVHEAEYRRLLHERVQKAEPLAQHSSTQYQAAISAADYSGVTTVFQSVADLFPGTIASQGSSYTVPAPISAGSQPGAATSAVSYHTEEPRELEASETANQDLPELNLCRSAATPVELVGRPVPTTSLAGSAPMLWRSQEHHASQVGKVSAGWHSPVTPSSVSQARTYKQVLKARGLRRVRAATQTRDAPVRVYYEADNFRYPRRELSGSMPSPTSIMPAAPGASDTYSHLQQAMPSQLATGRITFNVTKAAVERPLKKSRLQADAIPSAQINPASTDSNASRVMTLPALSRPRLLPEQRAATLTDEVATSLARSFAGSDTEHSMILKLCCPPMDACVASLREATGASVVYQPPYYSKETDVPDYKREYAGQDLCRLTASVYDLPPFVKAGPASAHAPDDRFNPRRRQLIEAAGLRMRQSCSVTSWEFAPTLPTCHEVTQYFEAAYPPATQGLSPSSHSAHRAHGKPQRKAPAHGSRTTLTLDDLRTACGSSDTIMSLELHVDTRCHLAPDPKHDRIQFIFLAFQAIDVLEESSEIMLIVIALVKTVQRSMVPQSRYVLCEEDCEPDLITRLVDIVRFIDPDILTGYEIHGDSWGYVVERAREAYDYNLCDEISRVRSQAHGLFGRDNDQWGFEHASSMRITGRSVINVWRAMRSELTLLRYNMESVVFHLFKERLPHYHSEDLTRWRRSGIPRHIAKVVQHVARRACLDLKILAANETISRTQEQARLLGIDFDSVILRGSQFKVESLMFRIAKPENFVLISPSKQQVGQENALECQPLIMEPQSALYTSPVLVMDFQSLYPSVIIAHNYCYSTCLGRVLPWRGRNKLGFLDLDVDPRLLAMLEADVDIAPNGIIFAKSPVRKSLLARMLSEILETRVMIKNSMKEYKNDKGLLRLLNSRQLALKYIANVTYGYTSAAFSGRMPCVEIADSIVSTGREILEKAIALIHGVQRWGAEVIYGDTDSLFIHLPGRSRAEAFAIGEEIAASVTAANPQPVKLKFEKVYHPCLLQSKKRYVGYKYEHVQQTEPVFDAKGIETIRRDGTPLQQETVETTLRILFETTDLSAVKRYFQQRCADIMRGCLPVGDFIFAKEVKLGKYKSDATAPPGAVVSAQRMMEDHRLEPQYGERVPYVVIAAEPGTNLAQRCVAPEDFLSHADMALDTQYYISKQLIPSLSRVLNLVGVDCARWYLDMPRASLSLKGLSDGIQRPGATEDTATSFKLHCCVACQDDLESYDEPVLLCQGCRSHRHESLFRLNMRLREAERRTLAMQRLSRSLMRVPYGDNTRCDSTEGPLFFARIQAERRLNALHDELAAAMTWLGQAPEEDLLW